MKCLQRGTDWVFKYSGLRFGFKGLSKGRQKNNSSRDELHDKNSNIHLERLQNNSTNCKGVKNNTNFGQITGIQENLDTACK